MFKLGLVGCIFKKVYHDVVLRRPTSQVVYSNYLIVDPAATDLGTAARVTHIIPTRRYEIRQMVDAGVYREVGLLTAQTRSDLSLADQAATGITQDQMEDVDRPVLIWECYCRLNISDLDDTDTVPLPYKVSLDRDTGQVLEIRRNWEKDDKAKQPKKWFVRWPYIDALGFYGIGLMQLLCNTNMALTAAQRMLLDAGMFANFPGFLYAENGGRQVTNQIRIAPGAGAPIQTGGRPLGEVIMPLPYKGLDPTLLSFLQNMEVTGRRLGGTADVPIG